jgi:hypothetical protein
LVPQEGVFEERRSFISELRDLGISIEVTPAEIGYSAKAVLKTQKLQALQVLAMDHDRDHSSYCLHVRDASGGSRANSSGTYYRKSLRTTDVLYGFRKRIYSSISGAVSFAIVMHLTHGLKN